MPLTSMDDVRASGGVGVGAGGGSIPSPLPHVKRLQLTSAGQVHELFLRHRRGASAGELVTDITLAENALFDAFGGDLMLVLLLPGVAASLRVLDLSANDLTDEFWLGAEQVLAAGRRSQAAPGSSGPTWPHLTTLNVSNNRFTERSMAVLRALVAQCPALIHLDLSLNSIGYGLPGPPQALACDVPSLLTAIAATSGIGSDGSHGLVTLDLSCLHVRDEQLRVILEHEGARRSLRRLCLRSNDLTAAGAVSLAEALPSMLLQELSVAGNRLGNAGLGALAFVLDQTQTLHTLDVSANEVDDAGLQTLFHVLGGLHEPFPLRALHLAGNRNRNPALIGQIQRRLQEKILETHIVAVANVTATANARVRRPAVASGREHHAPVLAFELALTGRKLKKTLGMTTVLTDAFVHVALGAIRGCAAWAGLEVLDLSRNAIETAGARDLGSFLALLPALRALNLSRNLINDEGVAGLADGIERNATLIDLDLTHNQITDDGARRLYLKAYTSNLQRRIVLSEGNPLTSECKVMVTAISRAYDLRQRFAREFSTRDRLEFVGQTLRQYGAAAIVECLLATTGTSAPCCTALDLSHNLLGDEGAVEIARLLRGYPRLERLDLSFNDIGDDGAGAIAHALTVNKTLLVLSLHSSIPGSASAKPRLTEKGLAALATALEHHPTLTTLDLRDNVMPPGLIPVLVRLLQRNPRIQRFNGSSSAVFLSRHEP